MGYLLYITQDYNIRQLEQKLGGGGEMGIYTGLRCKVKVKMTADT